MCDEFNDYSVVDELPEYVANEPLNSRSEIIRFKETIKTLANVISDLEKEIEFLQKNCRCW